MKNNFLNSKLQKCGLKLMLNLKALNHYNYLNLSYNNFSSGQVG